MPEGEACSNAIVFCNRKSDVDIVAKSLTKYGYNAAPIHGDLDQSKRMEVLQGFRDGTLRILCASDVAARGLDIPSVSHVFNFDVPNHPEDYVHRIGRTGRAGRSGKALTICLPQDEKALAAVEALVKKAVPRIESPYQPKQAAKKVEQHQPAAVVEEQPKTQASKSRGSNPRRGRDRDRRNDEPVLGMGDHLPSFMAQSFEERRQSQTADA